MKHLHITLLIAGLFAFATAGATPLTAEDVFDAIDGESEVSTASESMDTERVNFDVSTEDTDSHDFWSNGNEGSLDDTYY